MRASFLVACGLVASLGATALGKTWYVGGGGDFDEVQPAIDVASDGDLILVRPLKTYQGFILSGKSLTIRSTSGRFLIQPTARIVDIPVGKYARLGGIGAIGYDGEWAFLNIANCSGEVGIDDAVFASLWQLPFYAGPLITITSSTDVHMTGVQALGGVFGGEGGDTVLITSSRVQFTDLVVDGWDNICKGCGGLNEGYDGATAVHATHSTLVLARPVLKGGEGAKGGDGMPFGPPVGNGGDGGHGLLIDHCDVLILGNGSDQIVGGRGGDSGGDFTSCLAYGGDGGDGIRGDASQVSAVNLKGGKGGCGSPRGEDGQPYVGRVTFIDPPYSVLQMSGELHPGLAFSIVISGTAGRSIYLLFSNTHGWLDIPGVLGAPFVALPGSWFVGLQAGTIPSGGVLSLSIQLPSDPALVGFPLTAQAASFGGGYPVTLTDGATRIVSE